MELTWCVNTVHIWMLDISGHIDILTELFGVCSKYSPQWSVSILSLAEHLPENGSCCRGISTTSSDTVF